MMVVRRHMGMMVVKEIQGNEGGRDTGMMVVK